MRLLIADDHHLVREAIAGYLSRVAPDIVPTEASDLAGVRDRLAGGVFDIVLLDYGMPGMNGLDGLDEVRRLVPGIPVAIMSGAIGAATAAQALTRGAAGILPKDLHGTALLAALRRIAAGEVFVPPALAEAIAERPTPERRDASFRAMAGSLTARELQCVQLLVRGMRNREIGNALGITDATVKLHLATAFRKMNARNRSEAVRIALTLGIDAL